MWGSVLERGAWRCFIFALHFCEFFFSFFLFFPFFFGFSACGAGEKTVESTSQIKRFALCQIDDSITYTYAIKHQAYLDSEVITQATHKQRSVMSRKPHC